MLKKNTYCVYVYVLDPEKNHKSCPKNQSSRIHSFIYSIHLLSTTFCYVLYDHLGCPKMKNAYMSLPSRSSNPVKETGTHICLQWSEISLQYGETGTGMVCTSGKNYFCLKNNGSSPLRERKETEGKRQLVQKHGLLGEAVVVHWSSDPFYVLLKTKIQHEPDIKIYNEIWNWPSDL